MVRRWVIPYAIIAGMASVVICWALCVGFMNHGICARTIIAFMILVVAPKIYNAIHFVRKWHKKETNEPAYETNI